MAEFAAFLLSYETLRVIWWLFIGILLIGFAITDGFDLGVGALLPFLGRTDEERRVIINVIGPTWEGNQVWFVLGGGAVFAAWPAVYATAFSGFFIALILTLFALILRPVGFDYRSKLHDPRWRNFWDWGLFVGGSVPALVFGVAFGNLLLGVPFHFDADMRSYYTGSFFGLLNPFGLLAGIVSLSMLVMHGAIYLQLRTEGDIQQRAQQMVALATKVFMGAFALAGVWLLLGVSGYRLESFPGVDAPSNPLAKTVVRDGWAWAMQYVHHPWMLLAPIMGFGGAALAWRCSQQQRPGRGFIASSLALAGVILTAGFSLFPFIMPSSSDPNSSLTVWDATSSHLTLKWMFGVTVVFLPIVLAYTSWVFSKLRGTITVAQIRAADKAMY
ncbi:MAG TPA: cytochrome d ubiquinol oxidase subunit II [Candidatus Competibacteraceae bacterium]|nr:cytochrome d ubiquinol oxidase subunit II [Candidatus Competibacteraceae bacterium]HQA26771.1 cytochrome d ubiquinol oxidase subunit II [Candidatus Competibacteraceae bacterium]HQD57513.1 cytochrome d ubiquinol oxidase subunit II [Candidatus Competibacteraceae bacterium]